jgi:hypothetical protein
VALPVDAVGADLEGGEGLDNLLVDALEKPLDAVALQQVVFKADKEA